MTNRLVSWSAAAALLLAAAAPAWTESAAWRPPAGPGFDLLNAACSQCHGLSTIYTIRDGAGGWRHQVENMVLRGAQLNGAEVDTLVQYLATNFGPGSPRPAIAAPPPVTLPDGAGRVLVEGHCGLCHDLNRIVAIKRHKADWDAIVANMVGRGAPVTAEDARGILAYLTANFASD